MGNFRGWALFLFIAFCVVGTVRAADTLAAPTTKALPPNAQEGDDDPDDPPPISGGQPGKTVLSAELDAIIDKAGKSQPDWWNSVKLNTPGTLDMTWTPPAPGSKWDPNKNITQYITSTINPNPARHKEGVKLMHQVMGMNKDNAVQGRAMQMLGKMYGICLGDYARGAFWYRKAVKANSVNAQDLANLGYYYWKLGSKDAAMAELTGGPACPQTVRVMGSMGELDKALAVAKQIAGSNPWDAYLAAGDACRTNGKFKEAVDWYTKVATAKGGDPRRLKKYQDRASADVAATKLFEKIDLSKIPDGTYKGDGIGYRGPVNVEVVVKSGKIQQVRVAQQKEDWPLTSFVAMPERIIAKQSVAGVDTVSSATWTSDAVLSAAGKALGSATK